MKKAEAEKILKERGWTQSGRYWIDPKDNRGWFWENAVKIVNQAKRKREPQV